MLDCFLILRDLPSNSHNHVVALNCSDMFRQFVAARAGAISGLFLSECVQFIGTVRL